MEGFAHPSDADREFDELRTRAYGPDPDIGIDPPALARLHELEAAHRADLERRRVATTMGNVTGAAGEPTAPPASTASAGRQVARQSNGPEGVASSRPAGRDDLPRSFVQRMMATRRSRLAWTAGALVVAGGAVATALLGPAPRPDATLLPTGAAAGDRVRTLVAMEGPMFAIDTTTLRAHGSFRGLTIWSGVNAYDSPCLVAMHEASGSMSEARCAPSPADLVMDVSSSGDGFEGFEGLPGVGIIRFILHGDAVDAYVHLMPEAG